MDLSTLQNAPGARKTRKRVGRGHSAGQGKTCGRGHKGQKSRSGYSARRGFEGGQMPLYRRLPKRGFHHQDRFPFAIINVDVLEQKFDEGTVVTPELLYEAGLLEAAKGGVKVLGRGELSKNFILKVHAVSPGAKAKIEAAGGVVELIVPPKKAAVKAAATQSQED